MNQSILLPEQTEPLASQWPASLTLGFTRRARGVLLSEYRPNGPLYVQKPFYPEGRDLAHAYLLHPPGGLVSGDDVRVQITAGEQAPVLITTPGAGKLYRARPDRLAQQQHTELTVKPSASLEWFPLENILFPGANARLTTDVHLEDDGKFIGWEITSLGLPANGERFETGQLRQQLSLYQDKRLAFRERFVLDERNRSLLTARSGLAGFAVSSLMVAGPFADNERTDTLLSQLREATQAQPDCLTGITLVSGFLVIRQLSNCTEQTRHCFCDCWGLIRPFLLDRPACRPRIWNT